ncbi:MAG: hypothetical protein ABSA41_07785 [Terriglobia bacterium]|jgi:hypothetical protein
MKSRRERGPAVFLRRSGNDNAVLNWVSSDEKEYVRYRLMGEAYLNAAKVLVSKWSGSTAVTDFDAYPIIFLYRHALELLIKSLVLAGRTRLGIRDGGIDRALGDHSLTKLWPTVEFIFERMGWAKNTSDQESLHEYRRMARQLNSLDPQSMSFRYPGKKCGGNLLPRNFTFSVPDFGKRINSLCDALLGAVIATGEVRLKESSKTAR